jgi:hypothetical protein
MMQDQTTRLMEVVSVGMSDFSNKFKYLFTHFSNVFQQLKWTFPASSNTQVRFYWRGQEKGKHPSQIIFCSSKFLISIQAFKYMIHHLPPPVSYLLHKYIAID